LTLNGLPAILTRSPVETAAISKPVEATQPLLDPISYL
jgi:hypothetical protein